MGDLRSLRDHLLPGLRPFTRTLQTACAVLGPDIGADEDVLSGVWGF